MTEAGETQSIPRARRVAALALVAVGIVVAIFPDLFARATGYYVLNDYAIDRTAKALERDQIAFLLVSSLKASLALIEGSSIGVGFDLEVSDIVQPVYDYVDFFWRIFLYAFLVLGFYQILLETGLLLLGVNVMGFGIALFAAGGVHSGVPPAVVQAGRRMLLLGLLVAYVAPVSVVVSEALNERYVRKLQDRHLDAMGEFRTHLERASAEFLALRSEFSLSDPGQSMESLRNRLTRIGDGVSQAFHTSLTAFLFYMLGLIFELIVFPLLSAYLLYVFTRWGFGRILTPAPIVLPSPRKSTA
jgi:hypothetical protein